MLNQILSGQLIAAAKGEEHHAVSFAGTSFYVGLTLAILFGLMVWAKKDFGNKVFTLRIAQWFEQLYLFIENLAVGIIGSHGRKYIPMVMVLWMVIFVSNLVSLFFPTAPTADLGFNLALALIAIGYVQYEGMRTNGVFGHFGHFAGPKMGGVLIIINIMLFGIELMSEMMKNLSLTLRLYGNIDGGHRAADAMTALGKDFYVPFGAFLMPVKLLTCVVQALIFCLLFCVYLGLVTHHDHGDDHGHDHADDHAPAAA